MWGALLWASWTREITGAQFAALGVLDETRKGLARFLTSGIDEATHRAIGDLPSGSGVLGVLIDEPRALRLADVGEHPHSYGFPPGHPPMRSFLGVPVLIRGEAWGNLYLCEKLDGEEFAPEDEDAALILAQWAGTAIENARIYDDSEHRRVEAEQAVRGLRAARDITDAIGGTVELDQVLELIVKRGRALIDARSILIMLREGNELVVAACAGHVRNVRGMRLPISDSTSGQVLERGRPLRITEASEHLRIGPSQLGVEDAHAALLMPMMYRGAGIGVLAAFDRGSGGSTFSETDEQLLRTFASSAATAVAIKQSVEADRLRSAIAAADAERSRWARELHDQTLQALGGLRVLLASTLRDANAEVRDQIAQAIEDVEVETDNLRGIITDLRPSLLDDLGLLAAIEALIERRRDVGLEIESDLVLPDPEAEMISDELETTVYRLVQESLTNVAKHARALSARVSVRLEGGVLTIEVSDDGVGFDPEAGTSGFGLAGMRERIYLAGGALDITSHGEGTTVSARMPVSEPSSVGAEAAVDKMAS